MNALPNHGNQGVEGNIKKSSQPRKLTNHGKRSLYIFVWLKSMYYESIFLIFDCKKRKMLEIHRDMNIDT